MTGSPDIALYNLIPTTMSFIVLTLLTIACFYVATGRHSTVILFYLFWTLLVGLLSYYDFFKVTGTIPPRMLVILAPSTFYVIYFYRKLKHQRADINLLTAIHVIRVPVELVLYRLFLAGEIPVSMTFRGWNYDILTGIAALLLTAYTISTGKKIPSTFQQYFHVAGIVLLAVIVVTAILSIPSPFQLLAFEQPNMALLKFPYTLLPAVIVPTVLLSHLLALHHIKASAGRKNGVEQ